MPYKNVSDQRKEMIASKFKEMLQTKPLSKISVSELTRQCGINRKTFYYHFEDIFALLDWTMEQETIQIMHHYDLLTDHNRIVGHILDYIHNNHASLNNVYNSTGRNQLHSFIFASLQKLIKSFIEEIIDEEGYQITTEYKTFLTNFYTGGIVEGIMNEISKSIQCEKELLSAYIFITFRGGMCQSLQDAHKNKL